MYLFKVDLKKSSTIIRTFDLTGAVKCKCCPAERQVYLSCSRSPMLYPLSTVPCAAVSGDCHQREKELDTINSPQTLIATFVYLSFLSVLALHPSLHPSPPFSSSLSPSSTDQLLSSSPPSPPVPVPGRTSPQHPTPPGPAGKPETPGAHPG